MSVDPLLPDNLRPLIHPLPVSLQALFSFGFLFCGVDVVSLGFPLIKSFAVGLQIRLALAGPQVVRLAHVAFAPLSEARNPCQFQLRGHRSSSAGTDAHYTSLTPLASILGVSENGLREEVSQ